MRLFYAIWFFVCSGWGYQVATPPAPHNPGALLLVAALPIALATSVGLVWLELRRLPAGSIAKSPSLSLKPWNLPAGLVLFVGLTFLFSSVWGICLSVLLPLPGLEFAIYLFLLSAGLVGGVFASRYAFPTRFGA